MVKDFFNSKERSHLLKYSHFLYTTQKLSELSHNKFKQTWKGFGDKIEAKLRLWNAVAAEEVSANTNTHVGSTLLVSSQKCWTHFIIHCLFIEYLLFE